MLQHCEPVEHRPPQCCIGSISVIKPYICRLFYSLSDKTQISANGGIISASIIYYEACSVKREGLQEQDGSLPLLAELTQSCWCKHKLLTRADGDETPLTPSEMWPYYLRPAGFVSCVCFRTFLASLRLPAKWLPGSEWTLR